MVDCPSKFPLSWIMGMVDYDDCFAAEALEIRVRIDSFQSRLRTHTINSAAMGLVNHWLVQRELPGYEQGRMVDNFGALVVLEVDGDFGIGNTTRQDSIYIMRDELIALMQSYGMTIPTYLGGSGEKSAPAPRLAAVPASDPVPAPASEVQAERVRNGPPIKKAAFISAHKKRFPSIASAFLEASRNGLAAARVEDQAGMYYEGEVLAWAESKLKQSGTSQKTPTSIFDMQGTIYKRE